MNSETGLRWILTALTIYAVLIVAFMIFKMVYGTYADAVCLERGYRWSTVTVTGDIYCQWPLDPKQVLKIQ